MTNKEAIESLRKLKSFHNGSYANAIKMAISALEGNGVAQERKYTFGNDEFNLEYAYHDCKLVFDGITDDDSFQEADTGLILYYANEIIYALHEALKGKDTNVPSNDTISRQAAIELAMQYCPDDDGTCSKADEDIRNLLDELENLPSAQPEIIRCKDCKYRMPYDWMFSEIWRSQNINDYSENEIGCEYCDMAMKADDFCSRAERRTDETD